jgi:hypothetical protein
MHRRTLLATIATGSAALAGCSVASGPADDSTPTDEPGTRPPDGQGDAEPRNTGDPPEAPDGWASVIDLETGPRTYSLVPSRLHTDDGASIALWFDRTATADHPARVRGYLRNENPFENAFQVEWIPAVGRPHSTQPGDDDHEARLHMAPTENNDLATDVPEVTRSEEGFWQVTRLGRWLAETHRLAPGEWVELEYHLVGEPGLSGRPTGTYTFTGRDERVDVHVWNSDRPGPDGESRFAGRSLPAFDGEATTGWYHEADRTTPGYVEPSTERIELDGAVEFEVVNHGHEAVGCGHWNLYKLVDGEWFHVDPSVHTADCRQLAPGERMAWSLRAFNGEAVRCGSCTTGSSGCAGGLTRGYLGGGAYAAVVGYGHPADESAALVELVGDDVTIVPTDDVAVERDGGTATLTTPAYGDDEHPADATFTLTRAERADERLIAEQLMRGGTDPSPGGGFPGQPTLRNALAVMREADEQVVVRTDEYGVDDAVGHDADVRRFRFRGQAYRVRRDGTEE